MMKENKVYFDCISYLIENKIYNTNHIDLYTYVGNKYYEKNFEFFSFTERFLGKKFEFSLEPIHIKTYNQIPYFLFHYIHLKEKDENLIIQELTELIDQQNDHEDFNIDYYRLYGLLYSLDYKYNSHDDKTYISSFYINYLYVNEYLNEINKIINDIDTDKDDESIEYMLPSNSIFQKILSLYNVNTIKDLRNGSDIFKIILSVENSQDILEKFRFYNNVHLENISEQINNVMYSLTPRGATVLKLRNGFNNERSKTLDEIGNLFNCTRERIRQIESKNIKNFAKISSKFVYLLDLFFDRISLRKNNYVYKKDLMDIFQNVETVDILLVIFRNNENYAYDEKLEIIHKKEYTIEEIIADILINYDFKIHINDYNKLPEHIKTLINYKYKAIKNWYILKGLNNADLLKDAIELLLNGIIDLADDQQCQIIYDYMNSEYGIVFTNHNLRSYMNRIKYLCIDKSIYQNYCKCYLLPQNLKSDIFNYIFDGGQIIYYSEIFEKFKDKLIEEGIINKYYLKSLVDLELGDEYQISNHCIIKSENYVTTIDVLYNAISHIQGCFTAKDVKELLPNIPLHMIENKLEYEGNKILRLENGNFILSKNVEFEKEDYDYLHDIIEELIDQNELKVCGIKIIYSKIYFQYHDFFNKYEYIKSSFDLFTVLKSVFNDKFNFKRPMIGLLNNVYMNKIELVRRFAVKFREISIREIIEYCNDTGININSQVDIIDNLSQYMLLIDNNTLINKKEDILSDFQISNLRKILNLIIQKMGIIDSEKFKKYDLLPKLKYNWNKYLLFGILNSYLYDDFEVENNNIFNKLEFTIRRKNNG